MSPARRRIARVVAASIAIGVLVGAVGIVVARHANRVERVAGIWSVDGEVGESSLTIPIRTAHPECASWTELGGLVIQVDESSTEVAIRVTYPVPEPTPPCEWVGPTMRRTVELDAPLGDRRVVDAATGTDPASPERLAMFSGGPPPTDP